MTIYIILLLIIVLLGPMYRRHKKLYIWIVGVAVFLLMALKKDSVGTDTINYVYMYNNLTEIYVNRFLTNFPHNITITQDSLFFFYSYVFLKAGINVTYFLAISYGIVIFLTFRWIYKYSSNVFLSVFTYITIGLFAFSMSGLRQALSIAIASLAYGFIVEKKPVKFFITSIIANGFHAAGIILFPMYLIVLFLENKNIIRVTIISIVAGFSLSGLFYFALGNTNLGIRFAQYFSGSVTRTNPLLVLMYIAIAIVCVIMKTTNRTNINETYDKEFLLIFLAGLVLLIFSLQNTMVSRLGYYYIFSLPVVLSNSIQGIVDQRNRWIYGLSCCFIELIYFLITTPSSILRIAPYLFNWQ